MIIETDHHSDPITASPARAPDARPALSGVRLDMAAIFGEGAKPGRTGPPRAAALRRSEAPLPPAAPRRRTAAPLLAAALAGLILGMAAIGTPRLISHMVPVRPAAPPATTVAASPFETVSPPPAIAIRPSPPASKPAGRAGPVQPAEVKADVKKVEPRPAKRAEERPAPAEPAARGTQCEGDRLERHWCLRHDILKADRRLRLAYANAIREGVERRFLVAHQRRWTRLRDRASSDPDGVVAGYRELADDLERLSINGRQRDRIS